MNIHNRNAKTIEKKLNTLSILKVIAAIIGTLCTVIGTVYIFATTSGVVSIVLASVEDLPMEALSAHRFSITGFGAAFLLLSLFLAKRSELAQAYLEQPTTIQKDYKRG